MKNILLTLLLLGIPLSARSNTFTDPVAFSIDSMGVGAAPIPQIGDTVNLRISITANVTGPATLQFHFPGSVAPPNQALGETTRDSIINVDSGFAYTFVIPEKLFGYGGSLLEVTAFSNFQTPGTINVSAKSLDVQFWQTGFMVFDMSSPQNDIATETIDNLPPQYPLSISGKVTYPDVKQPNGTRGAYGVFVILAFHHQGDPFTTLHHPISGCTSGTHYCKVAADGSFAFNFNGPLWTTYSDVTLFVTKNNDASTIISGPAYTITVNGGCSPQTVFHDAYITIPITNPYSISQSGVQLNNVPSNEGAVLRNMEFSREFDSARGVSAIPTAINTSLSVPLLSGEGGQFNAGGSAGPEIDILPPATDPSHVAHEWGHYLHFTLNVAGYLNTAANGPNPNPYLEGFAEFHQFAVRNYIAANYDDIDPDWSVDNLEESCFNPVRFHYMNYHLEPTAGFACFLWNVYDGYSDPGFKNPTYAAENNDDIGAPLLIFSQAALQAGLTSYDGFESDLEKAVSPSWPTVSLEGTSIQDIATNMSYASYYDALSSPMRPAQVTNLGGIGQIPCDGKGCLPSANIWWTSQEYTSGVYINPPDGIHVYESEDGGSTWSLVSTLAAGATRTDISFNQYPVTFKVATFNSSGDAYDPPTTTVSMAGKIAVGKPDVPEGTSFMTVHPNPATNLTRICVPDLPAGTPVTLIVVNEAGQIVATLYNTTPDAELGLCCTLDCSKLPNGTYFARLWNDILGQSVKLSVQH